MLSVPTLAGFVSTVIFAASTLPMLVKAYRSRDLASYSLGNIALANLGNAVHSVYVYSLPPGPIWLLHTFYLVSSALMLGWYLRYGLRKPGHSAAARLGGSPGAERAAGRPGKVQPTGSLAEASSLQPGRPNVMFTHIDQLALLRWERGRLRELRDEWQGVVDRFPKPRSHGRGCRSPTASLVTRTTRAPGCRGWPN